MSRSHSTEKDAGDFTLHLSADGAWNRDQIQIALLADIRRQLRESNQLLRRLVSKMECRNTAMIPHALRRIDQRLAKAMPLRTKK